MRTLLLALLLAAPAVAQDTVDSMGTVDSPREAYLVQQLRAQEARLERLEARVELLERHRRRSQDIYHKRRRR
jgi:hypothetical protein